MYHIGLRLYSSALVTLTNVGGCIWSLQSFNLMRWTVLKPEIQNTNIAPDWNATARQRIKNTGSTMDVKLKGLNLEYRDGERESMPGHILGQWIPTLRLLGGAVFKFLTLPWHPQIIKRRMLLYSVHQQRESIHWQILVDYTTNNLNPSKKPNCSSNIKHNRSKTRSRWNLLCTHEYGDPPTSRGMKDPEFGTIESDLNRDNGHNISNPFRPEGGTFISFAMIPWI